MPELPEVETVRRSLEPHLPGRAIAQVVIRDPLVIKYPEPQGYARLKGQQFTRLERIGKLLILHLERDTLLVHLGMTGQMTFRDPDRQDTPFVRQNHTGLQRALQHPVDKHTHVSIEFGDGTALHYRDIRKFGKWRLYPRHLVGKSPEVKRLGPDPLTEAFTPDYFRARLKATRRPIKAALLDQGLVAGVGNIYADEALFRAGIRPRRGAYRLSGRAADNLHEAVRAVLEAGIENGGTTLRDFVDGSGEAGYNQESLLVYGRYGQACPGCGQPLQRAVVAQRTTTWCPQCQS